MSAVSAVDADDNNDTIVSSPDAEALAIENDVDTIDDLSEGIAYGDMGLGNDDKSVAVGKNNGTNVLSEDNDKNGNVLEPKEGTYTDLVNEINGTSSKYITLKKDIYRYDAGEGIIIDHAVTIDGNGAIIDMEGSNFTPFTMQGKDLDLPEIIIKNLIIKNVYSLDSNAGAICFILAKGSVVNCTFVDNFADYGGAISFEFCVGGCSVENCTFVDNFADYGGAIAVSLSNNIDINNCTFIENSASNGGAIYLGPYSSRHVVKNCVFVDNSASMGGAIYYGASGTVVEKCVFVNNNATNSSAVYIEEEISSINDNWWGSNNPDWDELTGSWKPSSYAVLNGTVNPKIIRTDFKSDLNYAFYRNGTADVMSLPARPIELSANGGKFDNDSGDLSGEFSTNYTSENGGVYEIIATVDNQEIKLAVTVLYNTWYVNASATPGGNGSEANPFQSLIEALDVVREGDTIRIASGKYAGENNTGLYIYKRLSLEKYGDGEVIFDAEQKRRIFYVDAPSMNITGLTFINGFSSEYGGAIYINKKIINSNINARFIGNFAGSGAAIYANYGLDNLNINATFINNTAKWDGGACLFEFSRNLNITGDFINNTAKSSGAITGGGGAIAFKADVVNVSVSGNFIGNQALGTRDKDGGAAIIFFYNNNKQNVDISGKFINNKGNDVILIDGDDYLDYNNMIHDSIFINNNVNNIIKKRSGKFELNNNWFGNNATNYDKKPVVDGIDLDNWLFLNATVDSSVIDVNESSKIAFNLYYKNSPDVEYNASKMNIDLDLVQTLGELNKNSTKLGDEISYTAKDLGDATVTGKFETASYTIGIKIRHDLNLSASYVVSVLDDGFKVNITVYTNPSINGGLSIKFDGCVYSVDVVNGTANFISNKVYSNNYPTDIIYVGSENYKNSSAVVDVIVKATKVSKINDFTYFYYNNDMDKDSEKGISQIKVVDIDGKPIKNGLVTITIMNKYKLKVRTDANGVAMFTKAYKPGTYSVTATHNNKVTSLGNLVLKSVVNVPKLTTVKKSAKTTTIKITLKGTGPIKGKTVQVSFMKKNYYIKTNSKGVAQFKVTKDMVSKLAVGKTYKIRVTYRMDSVAQSIKIAK